MVKKLRSLIQEKIPLETRVQIELISRRRDLIPKEKFEEVIKLLQGADIENIVPLGPGTNRFAFKLDGFVIKVATDDEGKTDNLKEFKMAKRLYPYVIKVYDVSKNGTLLVCEYIQPFMSYSEMCMYSTQIKSILKELSSVYLIGDVGINPQNYGNWGLRMGSNEPVCLDFAYIYSVSSELFKCIDPKCGGIMVPDEDFFALYCNSCKKKYTFQDIRARLGNDIHSLEIGDLTKEGYELTESGVVRELDPERSNYLLKDNQPSNINNKKEDEDDHEIPFVMEHDPKYYLQEEYSMSMSKICEITNKMISDGKIIIPGTSRITSKEKESKGKIVISGTSRVTSSNTKSLPESPVEKPVIDVPVDVEEPSDDVEEVEATPAFSIKLDGPAVVTTEESMTEEDIDSQQSQDTITIPDEDDNNSSVVVEEVETSVEVEETFEVNSTNMIGVTVVDEQQPVPPVEKHETKEPVKENKNPSRGFNFNMEIAVSRLANKIGIWAHKVELFDQVRNDVPDKRMYPETFYKAVNTSAYNSILALLGFTSEYVPNERGGTHKKFIAPEHYPEEYRDTAIFIERFGRNMRINSNVPEDQIMEEYRKIFKDHFGLQPDFLDEFKRILQRKTRISIVGATIVINAIKDYWCIPEVETPVEEIPVEEEKSPIDISAPVSVSSSEENEVVDTPIEVETPVDEVDTTETADSDDKEEEFDFASDEDNIEKTYISIYIYPGDDGHDVIRLNTADGYGDISIPMYTNLSEIDPNEEHHSLVDDRNGYWDWLTYRLPDLRFRTNDPEKWFDYNNLDDEDDDEVGISRFVILDKRENDVYIMGLYYIEGIYVIDDDGNPTMVDDEDTLKRLNILINECTAINKISHLKRTLSDETLIHDESYLDTLIYEEKTLIEDEKEAAAIDAVIGTIISKSAEPDMIFTPIRKK